ncbi:MAG: LLM class flavin-dependent oxidoreductase, partial [Actinomycetota bacterium]|nr:LLM class flavin-dependent oxidoreductase [Actinomycetota bacterium]
LDGCYCSDHYSTITTSGDTLPSTDAWATLAGLARDTDRINLGTMVSPATFRRAGTLAKVVATVARDGWHHR